MKRLFLITVALLLSLCAFAKGGNSDKGYNIQVNVPNLKNDTVYLAFYFNGKTYSKDTTVLNKGIGTFSNKEPLKQGIYIVYFNSDKFFDILVGEDQNIQVKVDTTNLSDVTIKGSLESMKYQELLREMSKRHKEQRELSNQYKEKKIDSLSYVKKAEALNEEVSAFQKRMMEENKGTFFAAFLKGTIPVETPEFKEVPDSVRMMTRYQYAKNHYFDNIDLQDPRFLRTQYFPNKVENYISKFIIQHPDSITMAAIDLIERCKGNDETYQTMCSKMINFGLQSKIMGMDAVWLAIADKYYLSGKATWADTAWVSDLRKEADKIRYNKIGMVAHNLMARDSNNVIVQLRDLKQPYVLVYFFEPSCGHCKKTTPVLHDSVYSKYKDKGFEVFAFYTQTDRKEWMDFVNKHKLNDWVNVWDPNRESWFWKYYDASSTPGVYLLDKERKFLAKKIDMKTLDLILNEEINKRNKDDNKPKKK
ncbi:MAG: DUF5106 domain-containing protein [Paludibacteraceae bacterium]|nr:DUF5106 domain-containing protein [Paludibacteraceae bacterium]